MVDHRIWVLETFLDIHLTPEQREQFTRATAAAWKRSDRDIIKNTLDDLKLYGKEAEVKALQSSNLEPYVDRMRADPNETLNAVLLPAFDAAHPERKDVMHARGLGALVGKWERGDAMAPQLNPITHRPSGISFTDVVVLNIFSDGRFQHLWSHEHCANGMCCRQSGTAANGTVDVQGSKLILSAGSGQLFSKDACLPAGNRTEPMAARREVLDFSIETDKAHNVPVLCVSDRPFQFEKSQKPKPFCYVKQAAK